MNNQALRDKIIKECPLLYRKHPYCIEADGWLELIYEMSIALEKLVEKQKDKVSLICDCGCSIYHHTKGRGYGLGKCNMIYLKNTSKEYPCKCEKFCPPVAYIGGMKEKYGSLRIDIVNPTEEMLDITEHYEWLSEKTCDICGKEGKPTKDGWIYTRCDEHYNYSNI